MGADYRCAVCRGQRTRCVPCRESRALQRARQRQRKLDAGICISCAEPAIEGQVRCEKHQTQNRIASRDSHARTRDLVRGRVSEVYRCDACWSERLRCQDCRDRRAMARRLGKNEA